ncbi:Ig-like domain-containing protein [Nocardioides salsibiostraticola]
MVATAIVVVAVRSDGYASYDADLNDGGIWVTSSSDGSYGRLNKPIGQLDGVLFAEKKGALDIVQEGSVVVGVDTAGGRLLPIDPATISNPPGNSARIPAQAQVQLSGGTLAVLDPERGRVWTQVVGGGRDQQVQVSGLDVEVDPMAELGPRSSMAVSATGAVFTLAAGAQEIDRFVRGEDVVTPGEAVRLDDPVQSPILTTVGETPVVLDAATGTIQSEDLDGEVQVPLGSTIQRAGATSEDVLVATPDELWAVDLDRAETRVIAAQTDSGTPIPPVRLGQCVYAAWSGEQAVVASRCGTDEAVVSELGPDAGDLTFRVNRNQIVLNDRTSGAVWSLDQDLPTRLDDWEAFQAESVIVEKKRDRDDEQSQGDRSPPRAQPDAFGARINRATVLHPLDNDTAQPGRLLAITGVRNLQGSDADLEVSPDGQTVQIRLPQGAGKTTFDYDVDDGRPDSSARATVTITPRADRVNAVPTLRQGYEPESWKVPAGGIIDLPVLPDWRDDIDGDLLSLESATVDVPGAVARTTAGGRIRLSAPTSAGTATIDYTVADGVGEPARGSIEVEVQSLQDSATKPATAQPDVASGQAGRPLIIRPLANDLPGSDPVTPDAIVELAGPINDVADARVTTDLVEGTVTFRSTRPGTYFLDYDTKYGNAAFDTGLIRVDIRAVQSPAPGPVAVPDTVNVFGQAPVLVDVLANDVDPAGGILVVEGGEADDERQLDVAVVQGRWLRIAATGEGLRPNPQVVRYAISNGATSGVQGEVLVTAREVPEDPDEATPVTQVDRVAVREGASVSVPVLDNDFSPLGDELSLLDTVDDEEVAGQLTVRRPGDDDGPAGQAYVSGRFVRYVAPRGIDDASTFTTRYIATDSQGRASPGRLVVTVIPSTRPNRDPEPPAVEGRVVAGDVLTLRLPGVGVDPDGDSVTLSAITSAPELGRVVSFGASSVKYQPYPTSVGTDEFAYSVTDTRGATASGTMRVAVVTPATSTAPVAIDDAVTLEPGRVARVDAMANDLVAEGDRVSLRLVDPPAGVSLASPTGPILAPAPSEVGGRNVEVVYEVDNGVATSRATVTLRAARPHNLPPVVFDSYAETGPQEVSTIDVLESAYDRDGASEDLVLADVLAPPGVEATSVGSSIRVRRGPDPVVVPFRVEDVDGGAATANLFVPALRTPEPRVRPDALIEIEVGSTATLDLPDYVVDPAGGPVSLTLTDRVSSSPASALSATIRSPTRVDLKAFDLYDGPATVNLEVTTGTSVDDVEGSTALVSIPVQVGRTVPILQCGGKPVEVAQGQRVELDIASICHPFTPDPADTQRLSFDADWANRSEGLAIIEPSGPRISVAADTDAVTGEDSTLLVTSEGSEPGRIPIVVTAAPPPRLSPIQIGGLEPGEERVVDVSRYLQPGVPRAEPQVVSLDQLSGPRVVSRFSGRRMTLRVGDAGGGPFRLRLVVSDVSPAGGRGRQAVGTVTGQVQGRPEAPTTPVPGITRRDGEVVLSWKVPQSNGSPITGYDVRGGGVTRRCGASTCEIGGLTNGRSYRFQVRARNAVGASPWSGLSRPVVPDARPGEVGPIRLVKAGDRQLLVRWSPPTTKTSRVRYQVIWSGGRLNVAGTKALITGLNNNRAYPISVRAINASDLEGPVRSSAPLQSIGTPGTPVAPFIDDKKTAGNRGAITLRWPSVNPNGPTPLRYTVLRDGKPLGACSNITKTTCDNSGMTYDGSTYQYKVRVGNANGKGRSAVGATRAWRAVGQPGGWGAWSVGPTGRNNRGVVNFTVPPSRGAKTIGRVLADGVEVNRFTKQGTFEKKFAVPSNDTDYDITLEVCNEVGNCSSSVAKPLQTYGGLKNSILAVRIIKNGPRVDWSIKIDNNGDPAVVDLRRTTCPSGPGKCEVTSNTRTLQGVDINTFNVGSMKIGYEHKQTIRVTLRDPNPKRGPFVREKSTSTGKKP